MPRLRHLAQCGVRVALRELFKRRALQLTRAYLGQRTSRQAAGLFAQRNSAVYGRAADAE